MTTPHEPGDRAREAAEKILRNCGRKWSWLFGECEQGSDPRSLIATWSAIIRAAIDEELVATCAVVWVSPSCAPDRYQVHLNGCCISSHEFEREANEAHALLVRALTRKDRA